VTTLVAVVLLSIPLGIGLYLGVLGLTSGTVHGAVLARRAGTGGGRRGGGHDHPASRPGSPPRYRSPRPSATS